MLVTVLFPMLLATMKFAASVLLLFFMIEVVLRFVPSPFQGRPTHEWNARGSLLGVDLVPGTSGFIRSSCSGAYVHINSLGWRDRERSQQRQPGRIRIAVLGDSFTEGYSVGDEETFTRRLETMFGNDVEVLNFGLIGIGTVQEEILFDHVVRHYSPDIVVLAFYSNDVMNNDPELSREILQSPELTFRDNSGALVSGTATITHPHLKAWLRRESATYRFGLWLGTKFAAKQGLMSGEITKVYAKPSDVAWLRAWQETETTLLRLQKIVSDTDAELILMTVPDYLTIVPDPVGVARNAFAPPIVESLDPQYSYERVLRFAAANSIPSLDLIPVFQKYVEETNLAPPYFYFSCDAHWNKLGHELAAATLKSFLDPFVREAENTLRVSR